MATVPAATFAILASIPPPLRLTGLGAGSLEATLLTLGRLVGLAVTGWLVATQILYTIAALTQTRLLLQAIEPVTLPIVRRVAAGVTAAGISLSTLTATAQVPAQPTVVTVENEGLRKQSTPTPTLKPLVEVQTSEALALHEPLGSYSAPLTWLVRPGDHLWRIAGEHLTIVLHRQPTRQEHARYWVDVVEAAQPIIRSGNPDLIYPGEEIPLPPTLSIGVNP